METRANGAKKRWSGLAIDAVFLIAVWSILTAGNWSSWIIGLPACAVAFWLRTRHRAGGESRFRVGKLLGFAVFFLRQSLRAGIEVARRTIEARPRLSCALLRYRAGLPPGNARILFANIISLLPGTLTVGLDGDSLLIHILDDRRDVASDLQSLEKQVAGLFGFGTDNS